VTAGPLDGVTVVDLTRILSGPYCTMRLAAGGNPVKLSTLDDPDTVAPPPELGEHRQRILREPGIGGATGPARPSD